MFAPSSATSHKKRIALLAVLGLAALVGSLVLSANVFAFVKDGVANIITKTMANGSPYFRVHPRIDDGAFLPSEIMIEILNPKSKCDYSVTIQSQSFYTGTAMLLAEGQFTTDSCQLGLRKCHMVYSWKPILPGHYDVLVHEIDRSYRKTPLIQPPHPLVISEGAVRAGLSMIEDRILNMPPCQSERRKDIYSHWEGDWLGPDIRLENNIRTGWSFLPSSRMACKLETFDAQALRSLPEKKSIYILGRSVERGIFLSLIDIMLEAHEKAFLKESIIGKCWGRATITKGNLEVVYQDFRSANFEDPTEPLYIECHNDKLVKKAGSSFIMNATKVWEEIFQEESNWPSVIYFVTGYGQNKFMFDNHVKIFVDMLPPLWQGTLIFGDFTLSGREGGFVNVPQYEAYLNDINGMVNSLGNDPRVRWIDGHGISKEMRMYGQKGVNYVARSQHFHSYCRHTGIHGEAMTVCSNVTEMMGQLLLGHAIGRKSDLIERMKQTPSNSFTLTWCHACPKCMLPFAIVPYPKMTCVSGPILSVISPFGKNMEQRANCFSTTKPFKVVQSTQSHDPLKCPSSCLEQEVTSEFRSESDTVLVRKCPIP
ncbi:hypothetical protein ACHAXA_000385 [Cyclostephanos tholiformis]|uniref:Uncharacterized protein n=1 Tax=Cyclostephanos tholiformis TaxID=382380 RepID=A0ABD3R4E7_9STRA